MKVIINSVHFKTDRKLEDFLTNKVEKLGNKYDDIISSEINLKLGNTDTPMNKITEIRISLKGNDLFASKQNKTFEEAADAALDALKRQLEKHKSRLNH
ncbi:MAG: ribosome-associated translation inhibitor RaiA [Bacteroidales bacterium]|nr:ribosome-associated translation inhibitor RaiA [Bacteroidales bacterium]